MSLNHNGKGNPLNEQSISQFLWSLCVEREVVQREYTWAFRQWWMFQLFGQNSGRSMIREDQSPVGLGKRHTFGVGMQYEHLSIACYWLSLDPFSRFSFPFFFFWMDMPSESLTSFMPFLIKVTRSVVLQNVSHFSLNWLYQYIN